MPHTEEEKSEAIESVEGEPTVLRAVTSPHKRAAAAIAPEEAEGGLAGVARAEAEGQA